MEALTPCPPWSLETGRAVLARDAAGRLPHAILLGGAAGVGKRAFARWLTEALLCRARTADGACGTCPSCRQLLADAHPDYRTLAPDGASETIRIDAVRELVDWLQLTARGDGYRLALLLGADTLNRNAANALLKTLEEPGERGLLVLVADRPAALPATVRSRCQRLVLDARDRAAALAWLGERVGDAEAALVRARGRPFAALELVDETHEREMALLLAAWRDLFLHRASVGRIVDSVADLATERCLHAFSRWTALALRHRTGLALGTDAELGAGVEEVVIAVAPRLETVDWFTVHDMLARLHRLDGASFRTRTVLEGLLADIRSMITARAAGAISP